jgi:hypothetical protein
MENTEKSEAIMPRVKCNESSEAGSVGEWRADSGERRESCLALENIGC